MIRALKVLFSRRPFPVFGFLHMDYVTRQFINLTKKFRKELRQTLQKQTDAIGQAAKAARESKQEPLPVPLPVLAELRTPEADKTENRTQYKESRRLQILLTLGTWLAFLAAAIYAGIAARQLDQMIRANRPWVAPFPSENTQAFRVTTIRTSLKLQSSPHAPSSRSQRLKPLFPGPQLDFRVSMLVAE